MWGQAESPSLLLTSHVIFLLIISQGFGFLIHNNNYLIKLL